MSDPGSGYGKVFGRFTSRPIGSWTWPGPDRLREAVTAEPGGVQG
jgi:hypothetical protein